MANARPGARAPHCWLQCIERDSTPSSIDLFETGFTLLVTPDNRPPNIDAAVPVTTYTVGPPGSAADLIDASGAWGKTYGIEGSGGVLVRPDGHVAWRGRGRIDATTIDKALARSLAR